MIESAGRGSGRYSMEPLVNWQVTMDVTTAESDEMFGLLCEALRRGPASPEWAAAVEQLKQSGAAVADEHRLLLTVRERLEAGQSYREVRAGPEFTRGVFERISHVSVESAKPHGLPRTTLLIIAVCTVTLIVLSGLAIFQFTRGGDGGADLLSLRARLFSTPVDEIDFRNMPAGVLPRNGSARLEANRGGLRLALVGDTSRGGTLDYLLPNAQDISGGMMAEALVRVSRRQDFTVELFAVQENDADDINANNDEAATVDSKSSKLRLAVALQPSGYRVNEPNAVHPFDRKIPPGDYTLRLKLDGEVAIAELNGQTLWSGQHALGQRVRFGLRLSRPSTGNGDTRVVSLKVLRP